MSLLPVREAQQRLLALAAPLPVDRLPLHASAGRWLCEEVAALRSQPAADMSAMDGYAIRFDDLPGPWAIIGESRAGRRFDRALGAGEAVRIFTGAPLPAGADTVVMQENVAREGDRLRLSGDTPDARGQHVRRAGTDFAAGEVLLAPGTRLGAAQIALAATGGHGALAVRRRPRIALVSTGDELVPAGAPTDASSLPASNAPMIAAMLADLSADVTDLGILPDDLDALGRAFAAARDFDLLVTSGGASVGDHDLVRPALDRAGAALDFWKVALKPGKPLMAGRLGNAVVVGLPGNAVSAYVTAFLFVQPLVRHLLGAPDPFPRSRAAPLGAALRKAGARAEYLRARLVDGQAVPLGQQDSAALAALAQADALIVRPPHAPAAAPGEPVELLPLG